MSTCYFIIVRYKGITGFSAFLNQCLSHFLFILFFNIVFRNMVIVDTLSLSLNRKERIQQIVKRMFVLSLPSVGDVLPRVPILKNNQVRSSSTWDIFVIPLWGTIKTSFTHYQKNLQVDANKTSFEEINYYLK